MNPDEAVLLFVDEYSRMAETYDAQVFPRFAPFAARLVERAALKPHATALDIGTGTGLAALLAAKAVAGTGLIVGIDLADGALALAQTKAARQGLRNLRFEMLDSRNIVYRGGTFDVALTSFGLPAIGHERVLREVHRVLKDGASFHILGWAPRNPSDGWDAFEQVLTDHRTATPSKTLAQLREASESVRTSGDFAAIREPESVVGKLRAIGFRDVRTEAYGEPVTYAALDDLIAFHASWGSVARELAEMGEPGREAFRQDLEGRVREYLHDGALRVRWSVVYYAATK